MCNAATSSRKRFRVTSISEKEVVLIDSNLKIKHTLAMTIRATEVIHLQRPTPKLIAKMMNRRDWTIPQDVGNALQPANLQRLRSKLCSDIPRRVTARSPARPHDRARSFCARWPLESAAAGTAQREIETIFRGEEVADAIRIYYSYQASRTYLGMPLCPLPSTSLSKVYSRNSKKFRFSDRRGAQSPFRFR